jgi:predicted DCC family thiol-disulfide oxidoreductase YuxK
MPPILLYDGVCGLCNRFVQFILRRDRNALFRFASLQSTLAKDVLARHGLNPGDLDTVYVVVNPDSHHPNADMNEFLLARSDAVLFVLKQLGRPWSAAASLVQLLPKFLRDLGYTAVARNRYRIFGRSETCILPSAEDRNRFLDL